MDRLGASKIPDGIGHHSSSFIGPSTTAGFGSVWKREAVLAGPNLDEVFPAERSGDANV